MAQIADERDDRLLFTTTSVAELLRIHPSTVKRWCDDGTLASGKTEGGHRRIHFRNVLDLARKKEIETFLGPFHPWEANVWLALRDAADRGSYRRIHGLALSWLAGGETDLMGELLVAMGRRPEIPFPVYLDEVVRGFMERVGAEWREGKLLVGEEHMASQVVLESLLRLREPRGQNGENGRGGDSRRVAVVGSMEGDQHDLGAQGIRVLLEKEGWRVYSLGANVPLEEFAAIQQAQGAELVCISFSPLNTLPDLQRAIRVLNEFYRLDHPYALALGGTLPALSNGQGLKGAFRAFSLSGSAGEFAGWLRETFPAGGGTDDPRSAA